MSTTAPKAAWLSILALSLLCAAKPVSAEVQDKTATVNGLTLRYKVVLPPNYDANKAYPAVLAFPPGGQDMEMVQATLSGNFRAQAESRGYIVIEPAAPNGMLFFSGGERVFPAFLTKLTGDYKILDNKFNAVHDVASRGLFRQGHRDPSVAPHLLSP